MKVVIFCPQEEFSKTQVKKLKSLGEVIFTPSRKEIPLKKLETMCSNCDILAFDPDNIGGFEVASERLLKLIKTIPTLKSLALSTTAFHYVDANYCKKNNIIIKNVPHYSSESVAEHVLAFLLGTSKRIFITDRKAQKGKHELIQGFELKGKTLGVIGLGSIGSRVAELGRAINMNVIAYNRTPKKQQGVQMVSIEKLLKESDAISLNLATNKETHNFLSKNRIKLLKPGMVIINTADRDLVDEDAMANALSDGRVDSYVLEAEDMSSPPLGNLDNVIFFRGFGWYTKDALERNKQIWVNNILNWNINT